MPRPVRTDVIVLGAGGAGVAAAIAAAEHGATVAVLDADVVVGGTARHAGGGTSFAGTATQAALGIADHPDLALEDWVAWGGTSADVAWAQRYLDHGVRRIHDRLQELGVRWGEVLQHEGNRVPRWHAPIGGGAAIMRALETQARRHGRISWHLATHADALLVEGGRVTGVATTGPRGPVEHRAQATIVATGGFTSDATLVREHASALARAERVLLGGGPGAHGAGHRMLAAVDARFVALDAVWSYAYATPDPDAPEDARRGLVMRDLDGDVWVNAEGERFHDESRRGGATGTPAVLAQPGGRCWSIFDATVAARASVAGPGYRVDGAPRRDRIERLLTTSPWITRAGDLRQLGERAGIAPHALERTVTEHNRRIEHGIEVDPDHGRPLAGLAPIVTPPLFAVSFFPLARKNLGGVHTDLDAQVLDRAGRVVPGLLAAGEVAGMAGGCVNGRAALEGTMLGPGIVSGEVAGTHATS